MMKKIFCILILFVTISFQVVYAAYAYSWTVDGENLIRGGDSVKNGTARWFESDEYSGGVLLLENYHGGQIKVACRGTCTDDIFAIQLVGDNSITVENGVGILAGAPIIFIGSGQLTIDASVPIGSGGLKNKDSSVTDIGHLNFLGNTVVTIKPDKDSEVFHDEILSEEFSEGREIIDSDSDALIVKSEFNKASYLLGVAGVVLGLFFVAFIIMSFSKKKQ